MASQRTAVVTGGTGYVATELIAQLLARGYAVRATLRSDPDGPRGSALRSLAAAPAATAAGGSLELVRVADLADPGPALHTALEGAGVLFHVASPFRFDGDPSDDIVRPAVEGTRAVLTAAAKHKGAGGLRRVVVTSSVCAIHDMRRAQPPKAEQYNEQDWNETSTIKDEAYWVSKVEAERLAWTLAEELGLDIVTILPNFVLGPVRLPGQGGVSVGFIKGVLEAAKDDAPLSGSWTIADVRDVAAAHIAAAEAPAAAGRRYIVSQPASISARFVTDTIKAAWPDSRDALQDGEEAATQSIDGSRAERELGLVMTPPADTLRDMAESLIKHGIAVPSWAATTCS